MTILLIVAIAVITIGLLVITLAISSGFDALAAATVNTRNDCIREAGNLVAAGLAIALTGAALVVIIRVLS